MQSLGPALETNLLLLLRNGLATNRVQRVHGFPSAMRVLSQESGTRSRVSTTRYEEVLVLVLLLLSVRVSHT